MSYDVYLFERGRYRDFDLYDSNMTVNVAKMWRHAGIDLTEYHKKRAKRLIRPLEKAVGNMIRDPETYQAMNPENGWGDYEGALLFLVELLGACTKYPKAFYAISH